MAMTADQSKYKVIIYQHHHYHSHQLYHQIYQGDTKNTTFNIVIFLIFF